MAHTHTEHVGSLGPRTSESEEYDLLEVAEALHCLSERMAHGPGRPLDQLVEVAVERVPGARWASVSMLRADHFTTAASTADQATRADALQYEVGSGPCVDAVLEDSVYVTGDVSGEAGGPSGAAAPTPRWASPACSPSGYTITTAGPVCGRVEHLLRRA
jgi:hypothetical protein